MDEIIDVYKEHLAPETATFSLPAIKEFLIAELDIPLARHPALLVLVQQTEELQFIAPGIHDEVHTLLVSAVHQHVDTQKLARELMLYKTALRRVFMRKLPLTPVKFIYSRTITRHGYTRTFQEPEMAGAFSREVFLEVKCWERVNEI